MPIKLSREHLGLILLTLLVVGVVKGFYLGLFDQVQNLRGEVADLRLGESGPRYSKNQITLLRARLEQATLVADQVANQDDPFSKTEMASFLEARARQDKAHIVSLANREDNLNAWQLRLNGSTEALTLFLHNLENAHQTVVVVEARFSRTGQTALDLLFEVVP